MSFTAITVRHLREDQSSAAIGDGSTLCGDQRAESFAAQGRRVAPLRGPSGVDGCPRPAIMIAMPTAEIYTLLLAGLLVGGVLWVVTRFGDRD